MNQENKENLLEKKLEEINTNKQGKQMDNSQVLNVVEKYISLIIMEFKDHLFKYNSMFTNITNNTKIHFELFNDIVKDYVNEIEQNQNSLYEMISKMAIINDELPRVEELYYKIKEMRIGLEKVYKENLKQMEKKEKNK